MPGLADEQIVYNVHELAGPYYVAVEGVFRPRQRHTLHAAGDRCVWRKMRATPVTATVPTTFTVPPPAEAVRTIILHHPARLAQQYPAQAAAVAALTAQLETLAAHPDVAGVVVDLGNDPAIVAAYQRWDVTRTTRPWPTTWRRTSSRCSTAWAMRTRTGSTWCWWAGIRSSPIARLRDATYQANERAYAEADFDPALAQARAKRYFLSDDYYAGMLPLPHEGREFYLPQVAVGRLVEDPAGIAAQVDAFLARPVLAPADALVTGYDFLIDAAQAMSQTLATYGDRRYADHAGRR